MIYCVALKNKYELREDVNKYQGQCVVMLSLVWSENICMFQQIRDYFVITGLFVSALFQGIKDFIGG